MGGQSSKLVREIVADSRFILKSFSRSRFEELRKERLKLTEKLQQMNKEKEEIERQVKAMREAREAVQENMPTKKKDESPK
mmetsp:Transcript_10203/g.15417  ORF Transcript_10203/g.15417 Transcript_10203/m.15417 type:complete len:81 (+) Transcript_10203:177-419(+)